MNVCRECNFVEIGFDKDDPKHYTCKNSKCVDPVTGRNILCVEARNYEVYCGSTGRYYEETDFKGS